MLRGLTTISYFADDVAAAGRWYTELLGVEPYFVRPVDGPPAYLEYRIGDRQHELGIVDRRYAPPGRPDQPGGAIAAEHPGGAIAAEHPGGAIAYWHVDDVEAAVARLVELGATVFEPVTERGPGFVTASVVDPFGNVLGVMFNQHYLEMLG
jgi:catechol 2,3-dioxygenase-like lactoylglutathione lyase family enzyme